MKTIVIVPAFNEEKSIEDVIKNVRKQGLDVVIINDGSTDNTSKVAKATGAAVVDLVNNLGIGGAVQTGYKYAYENDYDYAIQIDGDGQHNPKYIIEMIKYLEKNKCNMVIGSRFLKKTKFKQSFLRKIGGIWFSILIKLLGGKRIYDPLSGYRLSDRKLIEIFANYYPYDFPEPETNLMLLLRGLKVDEYSMEMESRQGGTSSIGAPLKAIWYMIKVTIALFIMKIRKGARK